MSFGFSVSDFLQVGQLAIAVYKQCRDCSGQYRELAGEARQLANVITDPEDLVKERQLSPSKTKELLDSGQGCKEVLGDLQTMLTKYESLSTKSKKIVDRLGWDYEGGRDLRDKLTANVVMLNQFYQSLISSSVFRLECAMGKLLKEFQRGSRDADSVSILTSDHASDAKDGAWDLIIQDLEDLGITSDIVNQHRAFVVQWFTRAISEGELAGVLPGADIIGPETSYRREVDTLKPENFIHVEVDKDAMADKKRSQAVKRLGREIERLQTARGRWMNANKSSSLLFSERILELQYQVHRLKAKSWAICNACDSPVIGKYYHCNLCEDGDFDLCASCARSGTPCPGRHYPLAVHAWSQWLDEPPRVLQEQPLTGNDDSTDQDSLKSPPHFESQGEQASMPNHLMALTYFAGVYFDFVMPSNIHFQSLVSKVDLELSHFTNNSMGTGLLRLEYRYQDGASICIDSDETLLEALRDWHWIYNFDTRAGQAAAIWLELTRP